MSGASSPKTIREHLIERLTTEFGQPVIKADGHSWSLARAGHAPINIQMDSQATPNRVAVWVFDPRVGGGDLSSSAQCLHVTQMREVEPIVQQIRSQAKRG